MRFLAWLRLRAAAPLRPAPCGPAEAPRLRKGEDTMDVWFDSGSSWAGVLGGDEALNYPADLYLEVGAAARVGYTIFYSFSC